MIGSLSGPRIGLFASESICPGGGGGGTVTRDDSSRSEAESCSPRHVSGGREGRKAGLETSKGAVFTAFVAQKRDGRTEGHTLI